MTEVPVDYGSLSNAELESLEGRFKLAVLRGKLQAALVTYEKRSADQGGKDALVAICEYLTAVGLPVELQHPITAVIGQLADSATPGQKPIVDAVKMAFAACAVDVLAETGTRPIRSAAEMVVREAAMPSLTVPKLLEFRKNVRMGRARPEAIAAYDAARKTVRDTQRNSSNVAQQGAFTVEDTRRNILQVVASMVRAGKK